MKRWRVNGGNLEKGVEEEDDSIDNPYDHQQRGKIHHENPSKDAQRHTATMAVVGLTACFVITRALTAIYFRENFVFLRNIKAWESCLCFKLCLNNLFVLKRCNKTMCPVSNFYSFLHPFR